MSANSRLKDLNISKYKHGINIHEQGQQQNEWTTQNLCSSKFVYLLHIEK